MCEFFINKYRDDLTIEYWYHRYMAQYAAKFEDYKSAAMHMNIASYLLSVID